MNGAILTEKDLLLEEQAIFPYAGIHNGSVPKAMEPEMRKGALQMIIFEELLYQQALREKRTVTAEQLKLAEVEFRKQFATEQEYNQVLQNEVRGSRQLMRERIRRSLLIEQMLKTEVRNKARVSEAAALTYYKANPGKSERDAAAELGISKTAVHEARESGGHQRPPEVIGHDGKAYPAKRPRHLAQTTGCSRFSTTSSLRPEPAPNPGRTPSLIRTLKCGQLWIGQPRASGTNSQGSQGWKLRSGKPSVTPTMTWGC